MATVTETKPDATAQATLPPAKPRRVPIAEQPLTIPFTILVDTRESAPYTFTGLRADAAQHARQLIVPTRFFGLPTGDYSIDGYHDQICVERKSCADLFGSLSAGRERFEREHQRMAEIIAAGGFAAVVIEAAWSDILCRPPANSRLNPKTVFRTWLSWSVKYRVHWMAVDGRRMGEVTTFRLLEKWWKEKESKKAGEENEEKG